MNFYDYILYRIFSFARHTSRTEKYDGRVTGFGAAWGVLSLLELLACINVFWEIQLFLDFRVHGDNFLVYPLYAMVGIFNFLYLWKRGDKFVKYYDKKFKKEKKEKKYVIGFVFFIFICLIFGFNVLWATFIRDKNTLVESNKKAKEDGAYILRPEVFDKKDKK